MSDWYYDDKGIYRCVLCKEPFAPGHTAKHHPTAALNHRPLKACSPFDEKLKTGMAIIHDCEESEPLDLGRFLR